MAEPDPMSETKSQSNETTDPVLLMLGVGKQLWKSEPGDCFIERLRSENFCRQLQKPHLDSKDAGAIKN